MSAVGNECKITTPFRMPVIKNDKTSDLYIDYENVELVLKECIVRLNGQTIHPEEYVEEFVQGFQSAYRILLEDKNTEVMLEKFFSEKSRVILRHTQQYGMYRTLSLHPDYMKSREDRVNLLQVMHKEGESESYRQIRDYEISSLVNLDIPYFEISGHSRDLFTGNGQRIRDFWQETPYEQWRTHRKELSLADMRRQCNFIRLSIGMLGKSRPQMPKEKVFLSMKERVCRRLEQIVSWICETAVITEKSDISWIGLRFLKKGYWKLGPSGMYLYDGISGIALFLGAYLRQFQNENVQKCFRLAVEKMKRYTDRFCQDGLSEQPAKTGLLDGRRHWFMFICSFTSCLEKQIICIIFNITECFKVNNPCFIAGKTNVLQDIHYSPEWGLYFITRCGGVDKVVRVYPETIEQALRTGGSIDADEVYNSTDALHEIEAVCISASGKLYMAVGSNEENKDAVYMEKEFRFA